MNTIWRSLLWKEWREHQWKLLTLSAICVLVPVVASLRHPPRIFDFTSPLLYIVVPISSMVIASAVAAGERARRTVSFLRALPVRPSKPAAAKLFCAGITVAAPPVLAVAAVWLWSLWLNPGEVGEAISSDLNAYKTSWLIDNWYVARAVGASLAGLSLLLWIAAASVNRSDEVRAAAIGLLVVVGCWAALVAVAYAMGSPHGWWYVLAAGAPGGPSLSVPGIAAEAMASKAGRMAALWPFAVVALVSHAALAAWFIVRYGRIAPGRAEVAAHSPTADGVKWLSPPRSSPLTAIFWQQVRVSGPLAVAVTTAIFAASIIFACYAGYRAEAEGDAMAAMFASALAAWAAVGMFVAIVAGMAVFMDDLDPRIHDFWRSRPVSVHQWFAVKFLTGLGLPLLTLPLPALAALLLAKVLGFDVPDLNSESARLASGFLVAQIGCFCAAMLMIILVRQAAYAAVLSVAAVGFFIAGLEYFASGISAGRFQLICLAASAAAVVFAWFALHKNWGWEP